MERIYEKLNIPKSCLLDNTIFKKAFLDNVELLSSDKKILNDVIKKIVWKYSLKPETINIIPYKSEDRDYLEIEVIEVQVNDTAKSKRIAEIVMRSIPYPILLIFAKDKQIQLATGDMRKNLSDSAKVTVDDFTFTDWFEVNSDNEFINNLLENLDITRLNNTDYYQMYKDITAKINIYNMSKLKGEILSSQKVGMSEVDIKKCYDEIQIIENQITKLKIQVKKADSIKEKVELNVQIDKLQKQKSTLLANI
jgi:hypothetical protein